MDARWLWRLVSDLQLKPGTLGAPDTKLMKKGGKGTKGGGGKKGY